MWLARSGQTTDLNDHPGGSGSESGNSSGSESGDGRRSVR